MAEFKEENLFTGAAQSQGFAPAQAPDISPLLRENAGVWDRNIAQAKSQQAAINDAELKRKISTYEGLGVFSPKFMEMAKLLGGAYINNRMVEANAQTRNWGLDNNFGVAPEVTQQQQATEQAIAAEDGEMAVVANEMVKTGEPLDVINQIKALPQYDRIVGTKNYITNRKLSADRSFKQYLTQENTHVDAEGNKFTTSQANFDPARTYIVARDWALQYDTETGTENFSEYALRDYNEAIRKIQNGAVDFARDQRDLRQSHATRAGRIEAFKNGDITLNQLVHGIVGTAETKDKRYDFTAAWNFVFEKVIPAGYRNGWMDDTKLANLLTEKSTVDPKKTIGEMYQLRLGDLNETVRKIKSNKRSELNGARQDKHRQILDIGLDYFYNQWDGDYVKGQQFIDELQLRAPEADLSPLKVFTAYNKKQVNAQFWAEQLEESKNNFTLSSQTLNNSAIPPEYREQYREEAAEQDAIRAGFELSDSQLRSELSTDLRESLGETSLDKTASGLQTATSIAVQQVQANLYRQYQTREAKDVSQAEAVAAVRKDIIEKKGAFAVSSFELSKGVTSNYFTRFTPATAQTPQGQMAAAASYSTDYQLKSYQKDPSVITQVPMVEAAVLQQMAADIRAGKQPEVPGIYRTLYNSNKGGYKTLAEFVNANLAIPTLGISERLTPTHTDRLKERTNDPGIQSFLDRADTVAGLQIGQALSTPGSTRDPRFMNPTVAQAYGQSADPKPNPGGKLSNWASTNLTPEEQALLRTIRFAEGTDSAAGYNTMFTFKQFTDMSRHPRQINASGKLRSDAAGAYQYLSTTWQPYADGLQLKDFSPESQDRVAHHHLKKLGVNPKQLLTREMLAKLSGTWASLPKAGGGSKYAGQSAKSADRLLRYYNNALTEIRGY
jgi:lysozyme